jgi:hypothetical protein
MNRDGLNPFVDAVKLQCSFPKASAKLLTDGRARTQTALFQKSTIIFLHADKRTSRVGVSRLVAAMMNCFSAVKHKMDLAYHHQKSQNGCL